MTTRRALTVVDLMKGRFAQFFPSESWQAWVAIAASIFGLAKSLSPEDQRTLLELMGRNTVPSVPAREAFIIAGRRAGKSRFAAWAGVFLACFKDYSGILAAGERGVVLIIAPDRRQARTTFSYVAGLLDGDPMLSALVVGRTAESITLANGISIEISTASFRSVRGFTVVAAVVEEAAFLRDDASANPDTALLAALRPAMATIPTSLLLVISSPYARRGELYRAWKQHFGQGEGRIQVFQATTRQLNPTVPQSVIDQAIADDAEAASAEYLGQFRRDLEPFVSRDVIERAMVPGTIELPPVRGVRYVGFVDPSGGSADSFTLAIAHLDRERRAVLDAVREVTPPFSPEQTIADFCVLLRSYGISSVRGDRYGGDFPPSIFRKFGIAYAPSEWTKSELFRDLLPLLNSGRVLLLDHPKIATQLVGLERRTARGGRDSIDHAPGAHDDLANAVAGAIVTASSTPSQGAVVIDAFSGAMISGRDSQGRVWRNRQVVFDPAPVLPRERPIRPSVPLPTVKIRDPYDPTRAVTINQSDFDPERHEVWREVAEAGETK